MFHFHSSVIHFLSFDQGWANLLTGGPQWVLQCNRGAGAVTDGCVFVNHFIQEQKYIIGYVQQGFLCKLKMNKMSLKLHGIYVCLKRLKNNHKIHLLFVT